MRVQTQRCSQLMWQFGIDAVNRNTFFVLVLLLCNETGE